VRKASFKYDDRSRLASRSEGVSLQPDGSLRPIVRPWNANHGLNTNLEIFDGGRRYFNYRAAQANVDASEASETSQNFVSSSARSIVSFRGKLRKVK